MQRQGRDDRALLRWNNKGCVHSSTYSKLQSDKSKQQRGVSKPRKKDKTSGITERKKGSAMEAIDGDSTVAALAPKVQSAAANRITAPDVEPTKDPYLPLQDSITIEVEPDLSRVEVGALKDRMIVFNEPQVTGEGDDEVVQYYQWSPIYKTTKKVKRRKDDGHVIAETKMSKGKCDVDLSDGKVYGVDWVLLSDIKEGAQARKRKKTKDKTVSDPAKKSKKAATPTTQPADEQR